MRWVRRGGYTDGRLPSREQLERMRHQGMTRQVMCSGSKQKRYQASSRSCAHPDGIDLNSWGSWARTARITCLRGCRPLRFTVPQTWDLVLAPFLSADYQQRILACTCPLSPEGHETWTRCRTLRWASCDQDVLREPTASGDYIG